ncbi:MAG: hypothetical protein H6739_20305 [Alphaproteobacteria bacterium]|nr:hypothetical protein [Alphaproteobacteria bacterium]
MTLLFALAGCTFTPGTEGFTTLDSAALTGGWEAEDPALPQILREDGTTITITSASLQPAWLSLQSISGAGSTFDPADPPEGYGLCHSGHCHRDDGALVDYVDIQAELAGGDLTFEDVVTWSGLEVDLLDPTEQDLGDPSPSPHLPIVALRQLEVGFPDDAPGLLIEGQLTGDTFEAPTPLVVELPVVEPWVGGMDLTVDRTQAPEVAVTIALALDETLFDGVPLAPDGESAEVVLDDPDDPAAQVLLENLLALEPDLDWTER